jgi:NAD-dependent dihydropyrimidine dehydrogenase PreA subunit
VNKDEKVYIKLQKHLNNQPVGFPATRSGAEIRILKHIFTPQEAEIATYLNYKLEPLETVFGKVEHLVESPEELEGLLDRIAKNGGIGSRMKDNKKHYCNAPLVVGMYEMQLGRLTPEFIKDFNEYITDKKFEIEFLSTRLPQIRTIPVGKSIHPQHNISTFDDVRTLVQRAEEPFVIIECICRKRRRLEGQPCKVTDRKETCLTMGNMAKTVLQGGIGREISRDEAMSIIEQNQKQGLVLQPSNTEMAESICSCCGCCCGMLRIHRRLPKPLDFWASNFHAVVDLNACDGCGVCEECCQVGALRVSAKKKPAVVNLNRCIGCGLCVSICPKEAISLLKKPTEVKPPETREELYEIIMAKKKGRLGKLKMIGKYYVDAIRTRQTHLLK